MQRTRTFTDDDRRNEDITFFSPCNVGNKHFIKLFHFLFSLFFIFILRLVSLRDLQSREILEETSRPVRKFIRNSHSLSLRCVCLFHRFSRAAMSLSVKLDSAARACAVRNTAHIRCFSLLSVQRSDRTLIERTLHTDLVCLA